MIQNDEGKVKCVSCESMRPGVKSDSGNGDKVGTFQSSSVGKSNFSFGIPLSSEKTSESQKSAFSFGHSSVDSQSSSGFSFGVSGESSKSSFGKAIPASSTFSFGVIPDSEKVKSPQLPFSFGVGPKGGTNEKAAMSLASQDVPVDVKKVVKSDVAVSSSSSSGYPPLSLKAPGNPFKSVDSKVTNETSTKSDGINYELLLKKVYE